MINVIKAQDFTWSLDPETRRIPASEATQLIESASLLDHAKGILVDAKIEAEVTLAKAREEGYAIGKERAWEDLLDSMIQAHEKAREFQVEQKQQLVDLSLAMLQKLFPRLPEKETFTSTLEEIFDEIVDERRLEVTVNPKQFALTGLWLEHWRQNHPHVTKVSLQEDAQLGIFACKIESELGILIADPESNLKQITKNTGGEKSD